MKVRKNKHKILARMDNASIHEVTNKMWFIRKSERCKSYSPWCPDCNARLFYKSLQRFPYSYEEWRQFELHQEAHELAKQKMEAQRNLMVEEMTKPPKDPEMQRLITKIILENNCDD